jgi:hypothetical protein
MLVTVEKIRDEQLRLILQNAQQDNISPWLRAQEAERKYFLDQSTFNRYARKGKIERVAISGRGWLYEPDIRRVVLGEYVDAD